MIAPQRHQERAVEYCGVVVSSRDGLQHELDTMCAVLKRIRPLHQNIAMVWCKSENCADYYVELNQACSYSDVAQLVFVALDIAFRKVSGGYNFLSIWGSGQQFCGDGGVWEC